MATTFRDVLNERLQDPEFKAEWDALHQEASVIQALTKARIKAGLSQRELARKSGIAQSDISKIESGRANPTLSTMNRLAAAMGKELRVEVV